MPNTIFNGREAVAIENENLRVTALVEGGHIAEVFDKSSGISPLWVPHWASIEPSLYSAELHPQFGSGPDAKLLAGIMGHNLCLDLFGGPSPEEASSGYTAHGEGSVVRYDFDASQDQLHMHTVFPLAQISFSRSLQLHGNSVRIRETLESLTAFDRPIAWTQHVTLGPPFLDPATTEFRASMTRSIVASFDPGFDAYLQNSAEFDWPDAPRKAGGIADLRQMRPQAPASGYTAHLADPALDDAYFVAYSPQYQLAFGYLWKRRDFPWMGIWEENCSRQQTPWNGRCLTRGMEFGVSPFPESRRQMVDRHSLFDLPTYRWLPARGRLEVEYWICCQRCASVPEAIRALETAANGRSRIPRR
jgi:hypothetical protein